jgi:serine/threonine protein kinase
MEFWIGYDCMTDLKYQANILIDSGGHAQLAGFGLMTVGDNTVGMISKASNYRSDGNPRYMAPELFDPHSSDMYPTVISDVYAFACVCLFVSLLTISSDPILTERPAIHGETPIP